MSIQGYELERWDGSSQAVPGEHGWELLLAHEDAHEPGRVKAFTVITDDHKLRLDLEPDDILTFIRRTRLLEQPGQPAEFKGMRYIVGKRKEDDTTEGLFYTVYQSGAVQMAWDSDRG